jgi:hypothetical protein
MRRLPFSPFCRPGRVCLLGLLCLLWAVAPARAGVLGDDINEDEAHDYNGMPRWRLGLETGYSQWIYNPDSLYPSYERYINSVETGWDVSAQAAWFPWAKGGIGAEWIWFLSRSRQNGVRVDSAGSTYDLRDRVSAVYYGPVFLSRVRFGRFGLLVGAFGAGLLDFHYDWTANGRASRVEARTFAVVPQVGWEYSFYRLVSFGVNARAVLADLKEYTFNGKKVTLKQPDDPHYWSVIGLTRFELNAGIRFGLD